MIYNYTNKGEWFNVYSVWYTFLFIVIVIGIALFVKTIIRYWREEDNKRPDWIFVSLFISVILIIPFVETAKSLYYVFSYDHIYKTQAYEEVSGRIDIIEVEEYSDGSQDYIVTFSVDGKIIKGENTFTENPKQKLVDSNGKEVTVRYTDSKSRDEESQNTVVVFEVFECDNSD